MDVLKALKDTRLKHRTCFVSKKCRCVLAGVVHGRCWLRVMCLSCVPMKAHAVSQAAGGTPHGDVHHRRSVLTTSINHQSNFIFLCCHVLISPPELMHDVYPDNDFVLWELVLQDRCAQRSLAYSIVRSVSGAIPNWSLTGYIWGAASFVDFHIHNFCHAVGLWMTLFLLAWLCKINILFPHYNVWGLVRICLLHLKKDDFILLETYEAHQSSYELP